MDATDGMKSEAIPSTYDVLRWVEERMDAVLARPGMWGPPLTVEVILLEHLDFQVALTTPPAKVADRSRGSLSLMASTRS